MIMRHTRLCLYRSKSFNFLCLQSFSSSRKTNLEILGLSEEASKQEIKQAYLSLSKEFHPDVNKGSNAKIQYQEVRDAYDQLQLEGYNTTRTESQEPQGYQHYNKEAHSADYYHWKRRNEKKKDLDNWLKSIQREAREYKLKMKAMEEKENDLKSSMYPNETSHVMNEKLSPEYLEFEKKFVGRLDRTLSRLRGHDSWGSNHVAKFWFSRSRRDDSGKRSPILSLIQQFFSWYARWILTSAPVVMCGVALTLLGQLYVHSMLFSS
eukprot:TRINITY_DN5928_c0_g1_i1.p1 TRINITY_DN5928_c0_g1~~TRINITY_DN5928_c0_g1_i1.p1  ORF type:complete len:265 (-),score=62.76 TRINITY_DN5928_c0_g1_i1:179-973(-)